jgi:NNP family nitrate/nitrite transporter-like MFS transporter
VSSMRSHVPPLLYVTAIFFFNFLARVVLGPLLPTIERDLNIGHGEAGSLFLYISLGYFPALLGSGFVSSHLTHRRTIILSSLAVGASLFALSLSYTLWAIRSGLILLGLSGGLYLPSGIATITDMVDSRNLGKAIAVHELAPNVGLLGAPLMAEGLMIWFSWRGVMAVLGVAAFCAGIVFARFGKGGEFPGESPKINTLAFLLKLPSLWIMMAFFGMGIGASLGIFAMLPLYLVAERGFDRSWANTLVALSRIAGPGVAFFGGWATDRLGPKSALVGVFIGMGIATMLLGIVHGGWIIPVLFLQPVLSVCFFPPGFSALSRIAPPGMRNVAVSLTMPVAFLVGGGIIPAGIGMMGEYESFSLGIVFVGVFLLAIPILLRYLAFHPDGMIQETKP